MAWLLQVSFPYFTGLARDVVTNTFHFDWVGGSPPGDVQFETAAAAVAGFYEDVFDVAPAGALQMAPWVDPSQTRFVMYDLADPEPRVPVLDEVDAVTITQGETSVFPMEASMVLSYRAAYAPGVARARQRGRIYLGGLMSTEVSSGDATSFPQWSEDACEYVGSCAATFIGSLATTDWRWVVFSRAGGGATYEIVAGWVDAEIDTQRRRGNVLQGTRYPWSS